MMQKVGEKVDQIVLKSGDFIAIVQQKLIDSTLSVEQMETTANIAPVTSAMHRKLTVNNDNNLLFHCSSLHLVLVVVMIITALSLPVFGQQYSENILSVVGTCPICSCSKELELCNNISKKKGLAKCLEIVQKLNCHGVGGTRATLLMHRHIQT